jgi:hypothetical protein
MALRISMKRHWRWFCVVPGLLFVKPESAFPQDPSRISMPSENINIYIDSPDFTVDQDYLRTEIPFVNYMRDRVDADVHILTTMQFTGSGGRQFTISFIGLRRFDGQQNTLEMNTGPADTEDMIRSEMVRYFKIGLMPFVSQSPAIGRIDILFRKPETGTDSSVAIQDPWKYWTFQIQLQGNFNGEKSYRYSSFNTSVSANRVTEAWKYSIYLSTSNTRTVYDYGDQLSYTDDRRNHYFSASMVKSLTDHWSWALFSRASKSTYNNLDLSATLMPGIEYNIYPYLEATRRQFTFQYLAGAHHSDYHERTIYFRMKEQRLTQALNAAYQVKQPWGSIASSLYLSQYFHDLKKYNATWYNTLNIRLFKGLSFNLYGYTTFVRDQLSLPGSGVSIEEILLRRRELETSYYYYMSIGISYTFGSIYNNIVNPRF